MPPAGARARYFGSERRRRRQQAPQNRGSRDNKLPATDRSPASSLTEPAQSLRGRVVVDAKVPRDRADASAAVLHRGSLRGDHLVDRSLGRVADVDIGEYATEGS